MKTGLWVVEMFIGPVYGRKRWEPTVGVALTRDEARNEITVWQSRNPHDKYRLRRYVPREAKP